MKKRQIWVELTVNYSWKITHTLFYGPYQSLKKCFHWLDFYLQIKVNPYRPNPGQKGKINLNFYFHTSLWCLKRFYEGLLRHHKEV